jgi:transporter family protein
MWILFAAGSAISAALVAIFAKIGLQEIDPTLATIVRGVLMATILVIAGFLFKTYEHLDWAVFQSRAGLYVLLSALAGAASWILYFIALRTGPASAVAVIDKFSVVLVILFASLFLSEALTARSILGIVLTIAGSLLILFK